MMEKIRIFPKALYVPAVSSSSRSYRSSFYDGEISEELEDLPQQNSLKPQNSKYLPGIFDVWAMGMTTVLGGIYYGWNVALDAGFASYLIAQVLMGIAFLILISSLAEIISTTSFSGGAYGMARVVLGFYPGFLVASFEYLEYTLYTAAAVQFISDFIINWMQWSTEYLPLVCLVIYGAFLVILLEENFLYWRFNYIIGIASLLLLLLYCFGSLPFTNFNENASFHRDTRNSSATVNWFAGGIFSFMQTLPFATWGFAGIESAALVTNEINNSRVSVSRGMVLGVITLFIMTIFTLFVACSLPSGGLDHFRQLTYFMEIGYQKIGISASDADWLIIPAQIAMGFGFLLPSTKLLQSMSYSRLIPHYSSSFTSIQMKVRTILFSYLLCLVGIYIPQIDIVNLPILFAMLTYLSDLYAFYRLQTDLATSTEKAFISPFGIFGAVLAAFVFAGCLISLVFFQSDYWTPVIAIVIITCSSLYYFLYAKSRQKFSEQEQKTLLTFHVIQANRRRKKLRRLTPSNRLLPARLVTVITRASWSMNIRSSAKESHHGSTTSGIMAPV